MPYFATKGCWRVKTRYILCPTWLCDLMFPLSQAHSLNDKNSGFGHDATHFVSKQEFYPKLKDRHSKWQTLLSAVLSLFLWSFVYVTETKLPETDPWIRHLLVLPLTWHKSWYPYPLLNKTAKHHPTELCRIVIAIDSNPPLPSKKENTLVYGTLPVLKAGHF